MSSSGEALVGELFDRRAYSSEKEHLLRSKLKTAEDRLKGIACVYATGSFGRCEASRHSDLDVFILGKTGEVGSKDEKPKSLLTRLNEITLKAELISATVDLNIPEFSGDGEYLQHYSVDELKRTLGTPEDDYRNTFTARLLLVLESRPLVQEAVYKEAIDDVVADYWRDYVDHQANFMPAFLANDILRLWRTFCVNYEARTRNVPEEMKPKRRLKNYKLKHSRLLTCYSAILYMLMIFTEKGTVSPDDVLAMTGRTPTQRLEWLRDRSGSGRSRVPIEELLTQYEIFLKTTSVDEAELLARFANKRESVKFMEEAYRFGDLAFKALQAIGEGSERNQFYRLLVV